MKNFKEWTPLKLRAIDDNDLHVFSQCIYEAIYLPSETNFNLEKKQFAIAIDRFTWEISEGKDHNLMQVLSVIIVNGVEKYDYKYVKKSNSIKNILSISHVDNNILILLNNDELINLKIKRWSCILEDIGKPVFPAVVPSHYKND